MYEKREPSIPGHHRRRDSSDDSRDSHRSKRYQASNGNTKPIVGKSGGLRTLESHREEMKQLQEDEKKVRSFENLKILFNYRVQLV